MDKDVVVMPELEAISNIVGIVAEFLGQQEGGVSISCYQASEPNPKRLVIELIKEVVYDA